MSDNFGERAATTAEVTAWVSLVKAGKAATRAMRVTSDEDRERDRERPQIGSGDASYESGE